jgi:glycosyltransferase involved in cell wall biosynthesis
MRILMVAPEAFFTPHGTPLSVYHRIAELEAIGHEIEVLTYPIGAPPPGLRSRVHRSLGLPFATTIRPGPSCLKAAFDVLLAIRLLRLLRRQTFDLIYAHEEAAFMAALATRILPVPYIYEMHSSLPAQIAAARDSIGSRLFALIERHSVRHARGVVATSPGIAAIARQVEPGKPVLTLLNLYRFDSRVSADRVCQLRQTLDVAADAKMVLYTGSFVELQALDLLVLAIPRVLAREPRVRFVFVGGQAHEIRRLRRLASTVGVRDTLILEPTRPQEEMPVFMAAADVLVSPRMDGLNAPGKLLCYLNAGRPVVATDCPVHTQILTGDTAILTPPTAAGLAQGILIALADRGLVARITANARRMVERTSGERTMSYERLFDGDGAGAT